MSLRRRSSVLYESFATSQSSLITEGKKLSLSETRKSSTASEVATNSHLGLDEALAQIHGSSNSTICDDDAAQNEVDQQIMELNFYYGIGKSPKKTFELD